MGGSREELQSKTRDELYEMAQEKDLEGRSTMSKDELADALSHGEGGEDQVQDVAEQMEQEAINVPDEARGQPAGVTYPEDQTEESQDSISAKVGQGAVTPAGTGVAPGGPAGGTARPATVPTTTTAGTPAPVTPRTVPGSTTLPPARGGRRV